MKTTSSVSSMKHMRPLRSRSDRPSMSNAITLSSFSNHTRDVLLVVLYLIIIALQLLFVRSMKRSDDRHLTNRLLVNSRLNNHAEAIEDIYTILSDNNIRPVDTVDVGSVADDTIDGPSPIID